MVIVLLLSWMLLCPIGMCCWIVPLYCYWFDSVSHWHLGGLFHTAPLAIYLTALVVSVLTVYVIILLGVSSRVCCLPADKGKGIADRSWAWRARRLYMWVGCAGIGFLLLLFGLVSFVIRWQVCWTVWFMLQFMNWFVFKLGYPVVKTFLLMNAMFFSN